MRRLLIVFVLLATSLANAQEVFSFEQAKIQAKEAKKPIMILFQGSDWCAPCIKWERAVWSTETFKTFAEKQLIVVKADFPRRKSNQLSEALKVQNTELAERYNPNGYFPFVVLLSPDLVVQKSFSYIDFSPEEMINYLSK